MSAASARRVLFVEPGGTQMLHLRQLLEFEGLDVRACTANDLPGESGEAPHLAVLNQAMLRGRTLAVARAVNAGGAWVMTLALVAPGDEIRGVELVERGLDSFMTLPCGSREFVARVRAMLRRVPATGGADDLTMPGRRGVRMRHLDIDPARRRVVAAGHELRLTEQEFQLLYVLAGHPGRVFDRQSLLDAVWGNGTFVTSRSVDALVKRLRHQLRPVLKDACVVETVRGVGYRLSDMTAGSGVAAS